MRKTKEYLSYDIVVGATGLEGKDVKTEVWMKQLLSHQHGCMGMYHIDSWHILLSLSAKRMMYNQRSSYHLKKNKYILKDRCNFLYFEVC